MRKTGIAGYKDTPGNLGAVVAVRDIDEGRSEILTLSWWTSLDAVRAFAGDPVDQARYHPADAEYLLTRPDTVIHYESSEPTFSSPPPQLEKGRAARSNQPPPAERFAVTGAPLKRVASAVGEGSVVISKVWEYVKQNTT